MKFKQTLLATFTKIKQQVSKLRINMTTLDGVTIGFPILCVTFYLLNDTVFALYLAITALFVFYNISRNNNENI